MVFLLPNFQSTWQNYCRIIFFSGTFNDFWIITCKDIWIISYWEKISLSLPLKSILSSFSSSSSSSTNQHVKLISPFPKLSQVPLFCFLCFVWCAECSLPQKSALFNHSLDSSSSFPCQSRKWDDRDLLLL